MYPLAARKYSFLQTVFFYTAVADYHLLTGKKGQITLLKKAPTKSAPLSLAHNRVKSYLWKEGTPIPFLVHLGIMNAEGRVYESKKDKFGQINRFLEMVEDITSHLPSSRLIRIIDFGCGKAYLTFALYYFLKFTKGYSIHITGLDLKQEMVQKCQELAKNLGYEQDLAFICQDINQFTSTEPIDIMVSLHACDTATDAALEKAIRWQASVILCVPCCQHELFKQVKNENLRPLLKHGILKERFAALATDAARAQLLETFGYQVQILEFIDMEYTPKNLLIRATLKRDPLFCMNAWREYLHLKKELTIQPSLELRFAHEIQANLD
jgi:SAM-dependent methyltransferase